MIIFLLFCATFNAFSLFEHLQSNSPLHFRSEIFSGTLQIGSESSFEFQYLNQSYYYKKNVLYHVVPPYACPIQPAIDHPVHQLIASLISAQPLSIEDVQIESVKERMTGMTQVWQVDWMDESFLFTINKDNSYTLFSKDFSIHFWSDQNSQPIPRKNFQIVSNCDELDTSTSNTLNLDFLNRIPASHKNENLKNLKWWEAPARVLREAVRKTCVFVHGSGGKPGDVKPPTTTFSDYWGRIEDFTPQCSRRIFLHMDTLNNGWDYLANQKEVCRVAVTSSNVISDTIIFTHSMGGLIFGGALVNGYCKLGNNSRWFASGMPANGSTVVTLLERYCSNSSAPIRLILDKLVLCQNKAPYGAYLSLKPGYPGLATVQKYASDRLNGEMCGLDAYGLNSLYSSLFFALQGLGTGLGRPNDGLVSFGSCRTRDQYAFDKTASSNFYASESNHADITCRNGNGIIGQQRKPCDWFNGKGAN